MCSLCNVSARCIAHPFDIGGGGGGGGPHSHNGLFVCLCRRITHYVLTHSVAPTTELASRDAVKSFIDAAEVAVIGSFASQDSDKAMVRRVL